MRILFLGGNGNISWHCVQEALGKGHIVYVLNREETLQSRREIQSEVIKLKCDVRNSSEMEAILSKYEFDVVCDFICYNEFHAKDAVDYFKGKVKQYIFISSESIYRREARFLPFQETCPKNNCAESGRYVAGKIKAEEYFIDAFETAGFPVTIIRPSYTYDTIVPSSMGHNCFTMLERVRRGQPMIIAGEGHNLWTFTHARDFARAFVELLGNERSIGEDYHITSDEWLTWNDATQIILDVLKADVPTLHIPFEKALDSRLADFLQRDLLYQKMWHNIYDNSKIKKIAIGWEASIGFRAGFQKTLKWLEEKDSHRRINLELDKMLEEVTQMYIK